jgi:hypothetical protein
VIQIFESNRMAGKRPHLLGVEHYHGKQLVANNLKDTC